MIITIRIAGQVDLTRQVQETLHRIRIRRKYSAVLLKDNELTRKLLSKIRNFVAYGLIDKETLKELIEKRGQLINKEKKLNIKNILEQIEKTPLPELNLKPFFRLHPPRKGIDAKKHFGVTSKAVLGDNKEKINELVRRML